MADGENESPAAPTPYEEAMEALSSMINQRTRGTKTTIQFDLLFDYLKILELEDALDGLKIVHVAGTKGKRSTVVVTSLLCYLWTSAKNGFNLHIHGVYSEELRISNWAFHLTPPHRCPRKVSFGWVSCPLLIYPRKSFWLISGGVSID
ncbi:unnamed protein product [Linum tenue]|uniref:Uncharacterized protein n=1 Tax=Linum tenue TaxID=586396 RepID=A0AAV0MAB6_9ROSI|nr:unnamed protein product [Linum tenue]